MPLYDVEKIIRKEPLEDYYDVGNELGRCVLGGYLCLESWYSGNSSPSSLCSCSVS